jgi:hypothetical protein
MSPAGTAECSPGRQSWVDLTRTKLVPLGTTEILCSRVLPSLTGLIGIVSDFPALTSGATSPQRALALVGTSEAVCDFFRSRLAVPVLPR